ncbi:translation initiation factor eIF3 subunit [Dactylonectria macrodidyma]|uniref:Eukaryotic translation initiation factor 3 subunit J n=1 Tax=Dactylonectria macrodidyma TaxID=307937 RepID=A0A9P9EFN9_9HYPO|nr:translation initiation factor eIF3 subunit [Dactylonectria macrodidyma]
MPPKQWDEEESDSDSSSSTPAVTGAPATRRKFDDEEDDSDVLDSWDADDSEAEAEKAKVAAAAKAKAAAEAAAKKVPKGERIAQLKAQRAVQAALDDDSGDEDETEAERRERLRRTEQEADLAHASDMFGDAGLSAGRAKTKTAAVVVDKNDPTRTVDIAKLPLFDPKTKGQFEALRLTIGPVIAANSKKAHYSLFLQELTKTLARDMPSDQIKKLASGLTALGNEKMKEEKAADKGGKKTKAAKTKTSLVTGRANAADTHAYEDDGFGDDDFM